MRYPALIILLISAATLAGCGNGTPSPASVTEPEEQARVRSPFDTGELPRLSAAQRTSLDSLYRMLAAAPLPAYFRTAGSPVEDDLVLLPPTLRHLFFNLDYLDDDSHVLRLPGSGDFRLLALLYRDDLDNPVTDLYAFTPDRAFTDRIRLSAIEPVESGEGSIFRYAEITPERTVRIGKSRGDLTIEALYYAVDSSGLFTEIRDGRTPAIAYESPDDIHYTVELFIWDYNANGTLYKKNLRTHTFDITQLEGSGIVPDYLSEPYF